MFSGNNLRNLFVVFPRPLTKYLPCIFSGHFLVTSHYYLLLGIERRSYLLYILLTKIPFYTLRAQSFTSMKADLRQEITLVFPFSRCLNGTFPSRKCSVKCFGKLTQKRRFVSDTLLIWINVPMS